MTAVSLFRDTVIYLLFFYHSSGNPTSYWPLDNDTNMLNLNGDHWGTFDGTVHSVQGARLGAIYAATDGVINLDEITDTCFTHPLSCDSGFTVSLWLKHWTNYRNKVTVRQDFITIGDIIDLVDVFIFNLFQQEGRGDEHLAVRVSASSRKCINVFPAPRSLWSHFVFVWRTTHLEIFRNGRRIRELTVNNCTEQLQLPSHRAVVTLKGEAFFDDLKILDRKLGPHEIEEMYSCVRGKTSLSTCYLGGGGGGSHIKLTAIFVRLS